MPMVGQRGGRPSTRSNALMGKFRSNPPSTQVTVPPWYRRETSPPPGAGRVTSAGRAVKVTGSKKKGMDIDARTALTTLWASRSS